MNSPIKLPPLPQVPWHQFGGVCADSVAAEAIKNYATDYAEQAAREALAVSNGVDLRPILADLLAYVDLNTCTHENRHKAGTLWTICDDCGRKWAADRNPYKRHQDAPAVAAARAALETAPPKENNHAEGADQEPT
jgi:hypothetical protein